ncbi:MAG: DUF4102 domain-containing protein [Rhizobiaceae bacterium]|nr:DUF4102 domain-containing protein [Rhizobiaceae bacterium]
MKERSNPTDEQLLRRFRRPPFSDKDPRYKNDAYWALRLQGHPHSYAKRAYRDELPKIVEHTASELDTDDEYLRDVDPDELFIESGVTYTTVEVAIRPSLSEEAIADAKPRASEYTIWDEGFSGFGLRVRPSGYKCFVLLYRVRGDKKLIKRTLGRTGNLTLEAARSMARDVFYEARY